MYILLFDLLTDPFKYVVSLLDESGFRNSITRGRFSFEITKRKLLTARYHQGCNANSGVKVQRKGQSVAGKSKKIHFSLTPIGKLLHW